MSFAPLQGILGRIADPLAGIFNGGILGQPQNPGGLLDPQAIQQAQARSRLAMAAALLRASGPSPQKIGFGQALGGALMAGQQAQDQYSEQALRNALLQGQSNKPVEVSPGGTLYDPKSGKAIFTAPDGKRGQPNSVTEYEYAKANGFPGTFQDWVVAGGQSSRPSAVQEWEFYQKLPPDQKKLYLEMKRNPNMSVQQVGGVPTVVAPSVSGTQTTALSTLPQEVGAAGQLATGKAQGQAIGEAQGGLAKKGINAPSAIQSLDMAEPLIDIATGSATGAAADKVAGFFGVALNGAKANAQLKVLQAGLMTNMPRMEGPQSDRDVQLYREAAGQIGDPTVPREQKKAALKMIRMIQNKYANNYSTQAPGFNISPENSPEARANPQLTDPLGIRRNQ